MKKHQLLKGSRLDIFQLINKGYGKFSDIQKLTALNSNELSYHLKRLIDAGLVEKLTEENLGSYILTEEGKKLYPYLKVITEEETPVVAVTAIAPVDGNKVLMAVKENEPDKGKLILIGGKAKAGRSMEKNAKIKAKEQVNIDIDNLRLRCINEFIVKGRHHWLVFFYTCKALNTPKDTVWISLDNLEKYDLFGDNHFLLKEQIGNKEVKFTKTEF
ncbi:ArsR family transcriptional regulator [Candidatus Woesearchaeota archaeon]|nr:ArsR family transcriptional regulator [Candidatus Woesearchaeota archaeon]